MKKITLYHVSAPGRVKQWSIWGSGASVMVEWGLVGHTLQSSTDVAKPKGKVGTKAYQTPEQSAEFSYTRQIRKKMEEGYRESVADTSPVVDLFDGLTKSFVPAKPIADLELDDIRAAWARGELVAQRKRNGQRHLVLITSKGDVRIYSRRLDDMTAHFPLLCETIRDLKLPKRTILDGEIFVERPDGTDDFKAVSTITRAKAAKGAEREAYMIRSLRYMVFDCLYFAGKPVWQRPYEYRYHEVLCNYVPAAGEVFYAELLDKFETAHPVTFDRHINEAKRRKWEGIVFWCWNEPTVVRDGGKPKRSGCIKWKVKVDYDVIATGFFYGSGKRSDVVGGFNIAEYDENGTLRDCGKCGSGLDMETAADALTWDYPLVIKIESDGQEPTGKFIFPVYIARHEDKTPEEVIGQDLSELE